MATMTCKVERTYYIEDDATYQIVVDNETADSIWIAQKKDDNKSAYVSMSRECAAKLIDALRGLLDAGE